MFNLLEEAKKSLEGVIREACARAVSEGALPADRKAFFPSCEAPKDERNGDLATGFALANAKAFGMNPRVLAEEMVKRFDLEGSYFSRCEIAGPGFINLTFSDKWKKAFR